ncbi:PREDICTED: egg cell-secreted protein 1.5-like [Camelina sativa]|uniref:Egg cell-secreted protein 1.5-like n=1 Tax=Camelina sativa TaxID=90675 RepID=A0ABM0UQ57_CAMSA|nr:PREDICTED: egg cell-secreted protein 1.5-like [Camelina sativa]
MATKTTSKPSLVTFLTISYLISTVHVIIMVAEARKIQVSTLATDHSGAGNLMDCWNAGLELKSCTDEIVKFFLSQIATNGAAVKGGIDKDCCGAVGLIEKDCWSVMFTSLGLTTMEGNNLREYCDFQAEKSEWSPSPAPETFALSPVEITYPGLN